MQKFNNDNDVISNIKIRKPIVAGYKQLSAFLVTKANQYKL